MPTRDASPMWITLRRYPQGKCSNYAQTCSNLRQSSQSAPIFCWSNLEKAYKRVKWIQSYQNHDKSIRKQIRQDINAMTNCEIIKEITSEMYNGTRTVFTPIPMPTRNLPKSISSKESACALYHSFSLRKKPYDSLIYNKW